MHRWAQKLSKIYSDLLCGRLYIQRVFVTSPQKQPRGLGCVTPKFADIPTKLEGRYGSDEELPEKLKKFLLSQWTLHKVYSQKACNHEKLVFSRFLSLEARSIQIQTCVQFNITLPYKVVFMTQDQKFTAHYIHVSEVHVMVARISNQSEQLL